MALTRCPNGHLFDARMHGSICPVCHIVIKSAREPEPAPPAQGLLESRLLYEEIDPVCGWLACIEGPRQGQSFTIHAGKNFIGRADDMDIRLYGDDRIARRNHAIIAYDSKNRQFMLIPGESDGMVYLEGTAVYTPTELLDMQVIQLGRTKLLFRPLCGTNFAWEASGGMETVEDTPMFGLYR